MAASTREVRPRRLRRSAATRARVVALAAALEVERREDEAGFRLDGVTVLRVVHVTAEESLRRGLWAAHQIPLGGRWLGIELRTAASEPYEVERAVLESFELR